MSVYQFGVGTMIGRRTDIVRPTPALFGTLQDVEVTMDQTLKELIGNYKMPVDVAPAALKVTFKAKFARIQGNIFNDLFFGQTMTSASGTKMAQAEPGTPAGSPKIVTVTNAANFIHDLGVFYAATGVQLTRVAGGSEAVGKYSVVEGTGVYTFNATDAVALLFYYSYTVTTLNKIALTNTLMGSGPTFELNLANSYTNNAGVVGDLNLILNACRSSKMTMPFKNQDYLIQDFDGQAFADQAGAWGTLSTTE